MIRRFFWCLICVVASLALTAAGQASDRFITVQSTTSMQNSGLFDRLLPLFFEATGISVRVVAVGTGLAIRNAANGDGDVLLVHDTAAEEAFVAEGHGIERFDVMYNDFVLVGPSDDPANVAGLQDVTEALSRIAEREVPFVSRGDDSGTHKAELRLWEASGLGAQDPRS
ncbi:MAG: substrate-binding domain-containing protein, partial [Pseudomonadota bacterium]